MISTMFRPPPFYTGRRNDISPIYTSKSFLLNEMSPARKLKIGDVLREFCAKSSIHGISYFTDQSRHWIERIWWVIAFALLVGLCLTSILSVWFKWQGEAVIINFSFRPMRVSEIPFPAVTVCPLTKSSARKFNYTRVYQAMLKLDGDQSRNATTEELNLMKVAAQVCDDFISSDIIGMFHDDYSDPFILDIIENMSIKFNETFIHCELFNRDTKCDQIFFPTITEDGLCYTFNSLNMHEVFTNDVSLEFFDMKSLVPPSNWNSEDGYSDAGQSYPYRALGAGKWHGLKVMLKALNEDIDHLCGGCFQGYNLVFHSPIEGPQEINDFFQLSLHRSTLVAVVPKVVISSPNIYNYSPSDRHCFFNSERHLRFYKHYTQLNCRVECLANFTLSKCGCVKFSMPRAKNTKICGPAKIECCRKAEQEIFQPGDYDVCNCWPACNSLDYDVYDSQTDMDFRGYYAKSKLNTSIDYFKESFSHLAISFKDELFIPWKRSEYHNLTDFLANSGGLIGLFMGASLISFIELIYYLTVRVFFMRRKQHNISYIRSSTLPPYRP